MANCVYCGKKAGFFQKEHRECREKRKTGENRIASLVCEKIFSDSGVIGIDDELKFIAQDSLIKEGEVRQFIINGWETAVDKALEDNLLSKDEETKLAEARDKWGFTQNELNGRGSFTKVVQNSVLREVLNGNIPEKVAIEGQLPFNFQKDEKLIWLFQNVKYSEQRIKRQYVGGYDGFSIRLAKGLYYRTGAFRGEPVFSPEMVQLDSGTLGITNKHLYFCGSKNSFRIKYEKIVSFTPFSDGIGLQRDATTAKPQYFSLGDGWFIYNLVTNLAKLS